MRARFPSQASSGLCSNELTTTMLSSQPFLLRVISLVRDTRSRHSSSCTTAFETSTSRETVHASKRKKERERERERQLGRGVRMKQPGSRAQRSLDSSSSRHGTTTAAAKSRSFFRESSRGGVGGQRTSLSWPIGCAPAG